MSPAQILFLAITFVLILGIGVAAQLKWLPEGKAKTVIIFIAGAGAMLSLRLSGLPPAWFEGSKTGFGIGLTFLVSAFLGRTLEERAFGYPFFLGLGLVMLIANVIEAIRVHAS